MSLITLITTAPLHNNGELVDVNVKRNDLDNEFKNNFGIIQNAMNYNALVAGSGLQTDNLGTAVIKPRNLSKQMGNKTFYFTDNTVNYNSTTLPSWDLAGPSGGTNFPFGNSTNRFLPVTTPLPVVIDSSNSTLELNSNLFVGGMFNSQGSSVTFGGNLIVDVELSTSPTFSSILSMQTLKHYFTYTNYNANYAPPNNEPNKKATFAGLAAGTYYIRPKIGCDLANGYQYGTKLNLDYQVSNTTFN
jgi:hypothetical protein